MYAAETNGDQHKMQIEEGISEEVAQKVTGNLFIFIFVGSILKINFQATRKVVGLDSTA